MIWGNYLSLVKDGKKMSPSIRLPEMQAHKETSAEMRVLRVLVDNHLIPAPSRTINSPHKMPIMSWQNVGKKH